MRTPEEFMDLVLTFARENEHIRMVGMEGSRVNKNIPVDSFQDFDITYFVDDISAFTENDSWLSFFGDIIMMQKPEDMELFPAEEEGYSYLILFGDYNKMDLTLLETKQIHDYLQGDGLRTILLDKDGRVPEKIVPSDREYWLKKPGPRSFDDCCNEFWNLTIYVAKGLCRGEILYAIDHLHLLRNELLRMLSWKVGMEYGFGFSVGKNYKFISRYLAEETWDMLMSTYREDSYENMWKALFTCHALFQKTALECAAVWGYSYPDYDRNVSRYVDGLYGIYGNGKEEAK